LPRADPDQLTTELLRGWPLPLRSPDKEGRGTVLVVGGAASTPGAALLAGVAALRMGAGRLQVAVPDDVAIPLAVALPEAKVVGLPQRPDGTIRPRRAAALLRHDAERAGAVLVGPGMTHDTATVRLLEHLLATIAPAATMVLDAAALTALADLSGATREVLRGRLVLTPNLEELAGLAGASIDAAVAAPVAQVARHYGAAVTCHTVVGSPDGQVWRCPDGGATLGTSGSGDVLAGLVAGAAARGAEPAQAAAWATYVHAQCGLRLGQRLGPLSTLARELATEAATVMAGLDAADGAPAEAKHPRQ
jgi:ADP-dependent NAD(P)H-hydrate dehydratase